MDENNFKLQLMKWGMKSRDAILPTSVYTKLYGHQTKTRIIDPSNEHLIYACVKDLEVSDELYKKLSEEAKMTNTEVLRFVQNTYEQYLKDIRKSISSLQKEWSKNYAQYRAKHVLNTLEYQGLVEVCDLSNERLVPIELILKVVFGINSEYGDHRRKKDKTEVYIDPRVLKQYKENQEYMSRTTSDRLIVKKTQEV